MKTIAIILLIISITSVPIIMSIYIWINLGVKEIIPAWKYVIKEAIKDFVKFCKL